MKPHPSPPIIRKTIKWGGAAVTVLLVVVWVGSGWWYVFAVNANGWQVDLLPGQCTIGLNATNRIGVTDWEMGAYSVTLPTWTSRKWMTGLFKGAIVIPLWLPAVAVAATTSVAWRLDTLARRRARVGFCLKCNYDRTGLAAGAVCPECGRLPT